MESAACPGVRWSRRWSGSSSAWKRCRPSVDEYRSGLGADGGAAVGAETQLRSSCRQDDNDSGATLMMMLMRRRRRMMMIMLSNSKGMSG